MVLTRTQRDNITRDVEAQLRGTFGELVFRTTIPSTTKIGEAHARFLSVLDYAPRSSGAKAYKALVSEIIGHGQVIGIGGCAAGTAEADHAGDPGDAGRGPRRRAGPDEAEGQGRGEAAPGPKANRPPRVGRRARTPAGGETKGRKLSLPADVHDRLWLYARQKRTTVSAVATEILDRNLPRFRVEREG